MAWEIFKLCILYDNNEIITLLYLLSLAKDHVFVKNEIRNNRIDSEFLQNLPVQKPFKNNYLIDSN